MEDDERDVIPHIIKEASDQLWFLIQSTQAKNPNYPKLQAAEEAHYKITSYLETLELHEKKNWYILYENLCARLFEIKSENYLFKASNKKLRKENEELRLKLDETTETVNRLILGDRYADTVSDEKL